MANYNNNNKTSVSTNTQIRNMYCPESYLNMKFFNTNLSFQFYQANGTNPNGRPSYNMKGGQMTTVGFDGAFALYKICQDIVKNNIQECSLVLECAAGATLTLERKNNNGQYTTRFIINKSGNVIPFTFQTQSVSITKDNQQLTTVIETGVGVLLKTVEGYLNGINADRHLDKLTDDFAKAQQSKNFNNNKGSYTSNSYTNKPASQSWDTSQNQQNMSTYQLM